jgi:hypothetical protein
VTQATTRTPLVVAPNASAAAALVAAGACAIGLDEVIRTGPLPPGGGRRVIVLEPWTPEDAATATIIAAELLDRGYSVELYQSCAIDARVEELRRG